MHRFHLLVFALVLSGAACQPASVPTANISSPSPSLAPVPTALPASAIAARSSALLSPAQGNLIANPGAEAGTDSEPADWAPDFWGASKVYLSWESTGAYSGQKYLSARIEAYSGEGDGKWVAPARHLLGGKWYEYSDFYRSDGRNRLIIACKDTLTGENSYRTAWQSHASPVWQRNSFRFYVPSGQTCDPTVMHVLDRNGWLHTDHHQWVEVSAQPLKRPLISISFDDIWATSAQEGKAELEKRGMKGSYYVVPRFAENTKGVYADTAAIKSLYTAGHEIGTHSFSHVLMTSLKENDIINELRYSTDWLRKKGMEPQGIGYPYGDFNEKVETETQRFLSYARTSLAGLNDRSANRYRLRIFPITKSTTTAELKSWVDAAKESNSWLILLFHDLKDGEGDFEYTTSLQQYKDILDYIQQQNLAVVKVGEGLQEITTD
ncbi:hypothetical protein COW36_00895 [bacterium (Candidatus Blackallbacteria) CG17_big_fil_post_rev_8_21_14_2_50_48_46]|uniref:NodB homology domain-containing protein n=1 Tax=bacterium (Candidatus Blackallbacteria) CG17_big_fil_post_rev_8_21_14_2_50_48_46 TaxID=2014261 RepID=A0A2M7GB62_9BACT|nr:MAG: hypothetical protein COW64_10280 [bacterium (Candidatus Blackallbacteria) CG18_big_fil_WC_8_21_14_2_50_49_26]PIW19426.1 MAG: hypothetical protein COW36_00895 [bacterium (Candidatus Blackallbacteria) CG17_big_fil_post_rev_8_21_14_2_50_48_46]PIW48970.1 MAG: hypothetical protein COW20_07560 [bacterium (Candidatus Blackallbacteria) CG13_big_fil_rev_8_21_14_2_50_49_14]